MISCTPSSNTPWVDGYVSIKAPSSAACASAFSRRSAKSTLPSASHPTTTTCMPAITALAGFVPWALDGMRHTSRCDSPRAAWYARMTINPANSPCAPEFGCSETPAKPVTSARSVHNASSIARVPSAWSGGQNGCKSLNSGHVMGVNSVAALSFMVHEPSGIIPCIKDKSLFSSSLMYRIISVSEW